MLERRYRALDSETCYTGKIVEAGMEKEKIEYERRSVDGRTGHRIWLMSTE